MEGKITLFMQIAMELEKEVEQNFYPGASLDSELRLAERFQVNRHTIRKSVDHLVMKGLIEKKRGVGLFVAKSKSIPYSLNGDSKVSNNLEELGIAGKIQILKRYLEVANMSCANWLKCSPGDPILVVETCRFADDVLFGIIYHRFLYKEYSEIYHHYEEGSLHRFIKDHYDFDLKRSKTSTTAIQTDPERASILKIPVGRPLLKVKSLNINKKNQQPVEFSTSFLRADMVELTTRY